MINGLYSSVTVLNSLAKQQEMTANNLAHLNTPGHRRAAMRFTEPIQYDEFDDDIPDTRRSTIAADFSAGRKDHSGRPLDLAIQGDGFFAFESPSGTLYSRSGVLFRDVESNQLVNVDGFPVLDQDFEPIVYSGALSELVIDGSGRISVNGQAGAQLAIVQFDDNRKLESHNQTWFHRGQAEIKPTENASVMQGVREMSNASPVTELISLIVGSRHFEAAQRAIRTMSDAIQGSIRA